MHKAQRGHKLSVVRKVVTPLNFVTLPSFSVTLPSCDPPTFFHTKYGGVVFVLTQFVSDSDG